MLFALSGCDVLLVGRELLTDYGISAPPLEAEGLTRITDDEFLYTNPQWSPDGSTIAVSRNDENDSPMGPYPGGWEVVLIDVLSSETRAVPNDGWPAQMSPAWSPGGGELAIVANDLTSNRIIVYSLRDESRRELECPSCDVPTWSAEGGTLLVGAIPRTSTGESGDFAILALDATTGETQSEHPFGEQFVSGFAYSPDGDTVLISDFPCTGIWLYSLERRERRPWTDSPNIRECDPAISPDGSKVAYAVQDRVDGSFTSIAIADADGSSPEELVKFEASPYSIFHLTWAPDGTRLAFAYGKNSITSTSFSTLYIIDIPPELQP